MFDINEELKKLPDKPGVYIMHDAPGNIIYVADALAFYMGIDREILVRAARANTLRLFSRIKP